jgi:hypothetical protein
MISTGETLKNPRDALILRRQALHELPDKAQEQPVLLNVEESIYGF